MGPYKVLRAVTLKLVLVLEPPDVEYRHRWYLFFFLPALGLL